MTQGVGATVNANFRDSCTCDGTGARYEYRRPASPNPKWRNLHSFDLKLTTTQQCGFDYTDVEVLETVGPGNGEDIIQFGEVHTFELRWNNDGANEQKYVNNSIVSFDFNAQWEAIVTGKVVTSTGAGVPEVDISIEMNGEWYETTTSDTGTLSILIRQFVYDYVQVATIYPQKIVNNVEHKFKCKDGRECTYWEQSLRHDAFLSDFEKNQQVVQFDDITVITLEGKVLVYDVNAHTCPIEDAQVCPQYVGKDSYETCVTTDSDGAWILVVDYDSDVEITASYNEHTMTAALSSGDTYIFMGQTNSLEALDFWDIQRTTVDVTFVGGTCDTSILDTWLVSAYPVNCMLGADAYFVPLYVTGGAISQEFMLGAQEYKLIFETENSIDGVTYESTPLRNDLFEVLGEDISNIEQYFVRYNPLANLTNQDVGDVEYVRFEFHMEATPIVEIRAAAPVDYCSASDVGPYFIVEKGFVYNMSITYVELYYGNVVDNALESDAIFCEDVQGTLKFIDAPTGIAFVEDVTEIALDQSTIVHFVPVLPQFLNYGLILRFSHTHLWELVSEDYVLQFFITGVKVFEGQAETIPLPRGNPLYILRDPPGDKSFSEFEAGSSIGVNWRINKVNADGDTFAAEIHAGIDAELKISAEVGAALGAFFSAGFESPAEKIKVLYQFEGESFSTTQKVDDSAISWNIEATESFSTSPDWIGADADMYLLPTWNIEKSIAQHFTYVWDNETYGNSDACHKDQVELTTWALPPDEDSVNAYSWISQWHIETKTMPMLAREHENITVSCPGGCDRGGTEWCQKICELDDAIQAYDDALILNEDLKTNSSRRSRLVPRADQRLQQDVPSVNGGKTWFNNAVSTKSADMTYDDDQNDKLDYEGVAFAPIFDSEEEEEGEDDSDPINQLFFVGGGSGETFTFTSTKAAEVGYEVTIQDGGSTKHHGIVDYTLVFINYGYDINGGTTYEDSGTSGVSREEGSYVTTSFTLEDDDRGDDFNVAVYEDEYGWLVFETISGSSSCPVEDGTFPRTSYLFQNNVYFGGAKDATVYDDESALWVLELFNDAFDYRDVVMENNWPFMLFPLNNSNGVVLDIDGNPFAGDRTLYVYPRNTMYLNLVATKPPGRRYDFDFAVQVYLSCWPFDSKELSFSVEFLEHCPTAQFRRGTASTILSAKADTKAQPGKAIYEIEAYNKDWASNPWPTGSISDTHAIDDLNIVLDIRQVNLMGKSRWFTDITQYDYSLNVSFGVGSYEWDIMDALPDGDYELRLTSFCQSYGDPSDPDRESYSDIWPITIDFTAPRIMPFPEPQDGLLQLGDEISFQFNEAIQCEFDLKVYSEDQPDFQLAGIYVDCVNGGADGRVIVDAANELMIDDNVGKLFWVVIDSGVMDIHDNVVDDTNWNRYGTWYFRVAEARADISVWPVLVPLQPECNIEISGSLGGDVTDVTGVYNVADYFHNGRAVYTRASTTDPYVLYYGEIEAGVTGWIVNDNEDSIDEAWPFLGYIPLDHTSADHLSGTWKMTDVSDSTTLTSVDIDISVTCECLELVVDMVAPGETGDVVHVNNTYRRLPGFVHDRPYYWSEASQQYLYYMFYGAYRGWVINNGIEQGGAGWEIFGAFTEDHFAAVMSVFDESGSMWDVYKSDHSGYLKKTLDIQCISNTVLLSLDESGGSSFRQAWHNQMSTLLEVSPNRVELTKFETINTEKGLRPLDFGDIAEKKAHFFVKQKNSELHKHEPSHDSIGKVLETAFSTSDIHLDYPSLRLVDDAELHVEYEISYVHPPACNAEDMFDPFIVISKSGISRLDNFVMRVQTSILHRNISFYFEDATNGLASFNLSSHTIPTGTHHWTVDAHERCMRVFDFEIQWRQFLEDGIGGLTELPESDHSGYKGVLVADMNGKLVKLPFIVKYTKPINEIIKIADEKDVIVNNFVQYGPEILYESDDVKISLDIDIAFGSSITGILKTETLFGTHIQNMRVRSRNKQDLKIDVNNEPLIPRTQPSSLLGDNKITQTWTIDISSSSDDCSFNDHFDIDLTLSCIFGYGATCQLQIPMEITTDFFVHALDLCPQMYGTPCGDYVSDPRNVDAVEMSSSCGGTLSGYSCDVNCNPGYTPIAGSEKIMCIDGQWEQSDCREHLFLTSPGTFEDVWKQCSSSGGHFFSIHSLEDNYEAQKICKSADTDLCYIGLTRSDRFVSLEYEDGIASFSWIDGTEVDFKNWDLFQPSRFRDVLETVAAISATNGRWGDYGNGQMSYVGICELVDEGDECIPLPFMTLQFSDDTITEEEVVSVDKCFSDKLVNDLFVTNGCEVIKMDLEEQRSDFQIIQTWSHVSTSGEITFQRTVRLVESPPVITFEGEREINLSCNDQIPKAEDVSVKASDHCDGVLDVVFTEEKYEASKSSTQCAFTLIRTWEALNSNGQRSKVQQAINVIDDRPQDVRFNELETKVDELMETTQLVLDLMTKKFMTYKDNE